MYFRTLPKTISGLFYKNFEGSTPNCHLAVQVSPVDVQSSNILGQNFQPLISESFGRNDDMLHHSKALSGTSPVSL